MLRQPPKFRIEQLALCPTDPNRARQLLADLGLDRWFFDDVHATGVVRGVHGENHALLQFNYQGQTDGQYGPDHLAIKPLELEILHYSTGHNWMAKSPNTVSHIGMHCTENELDKFREYFSYHGIGIAQEVDTLAHTNPAIKDTRRYHYAIFDTREILGVDLKFIVRQDAVAPEQPKADESCWPKQPKKVKKVKAIHQAKCTVK